jgi:hypothetical protein
VKVPALRNPPVVGSVGQLIPFTTITVS